jgi:hypothetical protein
MSLYPQNYQSVKPLYQSDNQLPKRHFECTKSSRFLRCTDPLEHPFYTLPVVCHCLLDPLDVVCQVAHFVRSPQNGQTPLYAILPPHSHTSTLSEALGILQPALDPPPRPLSQRDGWLADGRPLVAPLPAGGARSPRILAGLAPVAGLPSALVDAPAACGPSPAFVTSFGQASVPRLAVHGSCYPLARRAPAARPPPRKEKARRRGMRAQKPRPPRQQAFSNLASYPWRMPRNPHHRTHPSRFAPLAQGTRRLTPSTSEPLRKPSSTASARSRSLGLRRRPFFRPHKSFS